MFNINASLSVNAGRVLQNGNGIFKPLTHAPACCTAKLQILPYFA
jgi:hypothetical protein